MKSLITVFFLSILLFSGCKEAPKEKFYPSDYLFAQRSFPTGEIDLHAYRSAVASRLDAVATRDFEEPWQFEGPTNVCGRIVDVEMPVSDTETIYAGTASGGIYKTTNFGGQWEQIFDDMPTQAIGDIALTAQDPELLYVGTGEANAGGGSLAYDGLGVYRSEDGGQTWQARGLEDVGSIGRVVIDPQDTETVYVAAMGNLFSNNSERGVYKTSDGGLNWSQVLFLSDSTGAVDLAIHPTDGNILYAAMWERRRLRYDRTYGGETSGLYRSTDGGDSWEELTTGLPIDPASKGRIGVAISASQPNVLYSIYANTDGTLQGVFRSEDGGDSWERRSSNGISDVSFMWWFGRLMVNPTDPEDVYVTSILMHRSTNGGGSWQEVFNNAHVDHHGIFVHPADPDVIVNGNDGGVYAVNDGFPFEGEYLNGMSNFQFYTCEINPHDPEILLGGAQDNGTNVSNGAVDQWSRIFGGDGFRVIVDPVNPDLIYAESQRGNIGRSLDGGVSFVSARAGLSGSFNWNTPIAMDPNDNNILYTGSQRLFRTSNQAVSWISISDNLVNPDNPVGINTFGTITTIDVSSHDSGVIYVGTDDGNVWVRQGGDFINISNGLPRRWMTSVTHDPHLASGVYVTVSGFRFGEEDGAQVFYSDDFGDNWRAIGSSLPDIPVNDLVADDLLPGQVYVATDVGIYRGENRGDWWVPLGTDLPLVPVIDIDYDAGSRTLAAATYGRGMYTYDLPSELSSTTDQQETASLHVYPNPAIDRLSINVDHDVEWRIVDMSSRLVQQGTGDRADVSALTTGMYLLEAADGRKARFNKSAN